MSDVNMTYPRVLCRRKNKPYFCHHAECQPAPSVSVLRDCGKCERGCGRAYGPPRREVMGCFGATSGAPATWFCTEACRDRAKAKADEAPAAASILRDCGKCYPCWCRAAGDPLAEPCMRPKVVDQHVRIWKRGGYWTVEMFSGDELAAAYIGELDLGGAFERCKTWLTEQEKQLQANLARNEGMR